VFTKDCQRVHPEPAEFNSHPVSLKSVLIVSFHLRLILPGGLLHSGLQTDILYAFLIMRATCSAHRILHNLIAIKIYDDVWGSGSAATSL
jgi:hypothetical protein